MSRAWIFLLGMTGIVTTNCVGFTMNRSDTDILIPAIWPGPTFKADRRGSIQMLFDGKIHAADRDNVLRGTNADKSTKEEEECSSCSDDSPRVRRSDDIHHQENQLTVKHKNASEFKESTIVSSSSRTSNVAKEKSSDSEAPRNVVFLLVENAGPDEEIVWSSFGAGREFSVQGFLQNCPSTDLSEGSSKFLLSESLVSGGKNECECERFLRANVGSLLSWARHTKNMATVSASNFSIPSPMGYERLSSRVTKEAEDNDDVNGIKQNARLSRSSLRANRRLIELQKQSTLSSSMPTFNPESATKPDGLNGYDGMWDVFDMFSRIRMAFFRILLESLGNLRGSEDEFSGRRPFPVQPSVVDLVSDTLRELKSVPNDQGFLMVVDAPGNELSAVVQVLQSEVSIEDTLLVVLGMCSENNEPVRLFANGPGGKALLNDRTVWDVPRSIRRIISNGCHGKICMNKSREESVAVPSLEQLMSFTNDLPRKRVARAKEEDETTSSTADDKTSKDTVDADNTSDEKTFVPERKEQSGAEISRIDKVAAILGTVTSITAMFALTS